MEESTPMKITAHTKYIVSTSGRIKSLNRYKKLLQDILKIDVAYLPIHSGDTHRTAIDPQRFVSALKGMPCIGGAISRDIKASVVPYLDSIDGIAAKVKAVNTVIVEDGRLVGYNTDALGFRAAILTGFEKSGLQVASAVCYGYGGVTSVVVAVLQELNIKVYLTGRNQERLKAKANELNVEIWRGHNVDLLVNASPATERPLEEAPNFLDCIKSCSIAFDHEMPGQYLRDYCESNSLFLIDGESMYYPQMYAQWSLFLKGYVEEKDIPSLIAQANT